MLLDAGKVRRLQQGGHRRRLVEAMLDQQPAAGPEMALGLRDNQADRGQAVGSGGKCQRRLEAQVALRKMRIIQGDVRRIGDNEIESLLRHRREPVALDRANRGLEFPGIATGEEQGGRRQFRRSDPRRRDFQRQGDGEAAAAGTQVEDIRAHPGAKLGNPQVDQKLGFRARNQHLSRDREGAPIEFPRPDQIGARLAFIPAQDQIGQLCCRSRGQRVPATETQGRIHTSACTVAVLPEADPQVEVAINPADLRIDTFRASGAGGQHINKTDSAVRITHLPTGIVVECQDDRSQHRNKAQALSVLAARIQDKQTREQQAQIASTRKSLIGSGDRSERIRTYNFPQGRITDHRINLTLYKIDAIMDGDLDELIGALTNEHQAELLAALSEEAA